MEGADGEQAGELSGPGINTAGISDSDPGRIFPSLRKTPPLGLSFRLASPGFLRAAGVSFARVSYWSEFCIAVWVEQRRSGTHLSAAAGTGFNPQMQSYLPRKNVCRRVDERPGAPKFTFLNSIFSFGINPGNLCYNSSFFDLRGLGPLRASFC